MLKQVCNAIKEWLFEHWAGFGAVVGLILGIALTLIEEDRTGYLPGKVMGIVIITLAGTFIGFIAQVLFEIIHDLIRWINPKTRAQDRAKEEQERMKAANREEYWRRMRDMEEFEERNPRMKLSPSEWKEYQERYQYLLDDKDSK